MLKDSDDGWTSKTGQALTMSRFLNYFVSIKFTPGLEWVNFSWAQ